MSYRKIHIALFNGRAVWRDSAGELYSVDCQDNIDGRIILPRIGTCLIWGENLFLGAAEAFSDGSVNLWPFGFHEDDEMTIPWNRWMPLTDAEKAAKHTFI